MIIIQNKLLLELLLSFNKLCESLSLVERKEFETYLNL